jgi:Flp pilus assembly protein TadG
MIKPLKALHSSRLRDQQGVTIILVAILMFVFLGIAALAIDLSNLYVVRNELQNAADAGALAGARVLYNDEGTAVNVGANQIACAAATANKALAMTGAIAVDVNWGDGNCNGADNEGDVQRGHWSFTTRTFTPDASLLPVDLNVPTEVLDTYDPNNPFINAVRVVARRQATPAASFFARIFGYQDFELWKEAVAYIGFAGDLGPGEADQPIAICQQSILFGEEENQHYDCSIGRMLNSGSNINTSNSGGWTNFSQPCETANVPSLRPLICGSGNPDIINFSDGIGAVNGVQDTIFTDLESCWLTRTDSDGDGRPDTTWELTLPVIDCPGNSVSNCAVMTGAVTLKVVWVQRDNPGYVQAPREMSDSETGPDWPSASELDTLVQDLEPYFVGGGPSDVFPSFPAGTTVRSVFSGSTGNAEDSGRVRWASFVHRFNLRNVGPGDSAPYATFAFKSIYFLPSCTPHERVGTSKGENYGILALIPVLVK